eukprot:TRINITY_DN27792_c0_g2_i1.p1 TRINITY_DN27792_c0_g2~~TRINITY_DN27792_c0_g2_i1.p1  ORF type:complete len:492 (-),score=88.14 TRINITY_DN27792_c0_g2_i1:110-1585(-)
MTSPAVNVSKRVADDQDGCDEKRSRLKTSNSMMVMKFGGTSVATAAEIRRAAEIVRQRLPSRPVLVLSAMGKTTNMLLKAAQVAELQGTVDISEIRQIVVGALDELGVEMPESIQNMLEELTRILSGVSLLKEVSGRTRDLVVSFGERISVRVFAAHYNKAFAADGLEARALDSWEVGMRTTSGVGSANSAFSQVELLPSAKPNICSFFRPLLETYSFLPVVTGFIAKDEQGIITTLGRDGSDVSASLIGAAIGASEVQIWKDVPGILTTDPRIVPKARVVDVITYEEASELSTFGSKVVHPSAILPASTEGILISVRNCMTPELPGTRIVQELSSNEERTGLVAAICSKRNITMIVIKSSRMLGQHGFLARIFNLFAEFEVSIDVIATSEVSVSLTIDPTYKEINMTKLVARLEEVATVQLSDGLAMLTLIADKQGSSSVLKSCFQTFVDRGVNVILVSHGASNVNVTFLIEDKDVRTSIEGLHSVFFEP